MEKYDTSQLTEFPRFEAEATQSGVSTFFNKLWKLPLFTPSEAESDQAKGSEDEKREDPSAAEEKKEEEFIESDVTSYAQEPYEGRSLPNVVRRITSLIALGSGGGTKYSDTELARYWMPDDISRECYECAARFSTLRRRHHCRVCGQIFCSRCCSQRVPGHIFGCAGGLRVCNYCCNVVLSYLNENVDLNGEISPDLRSLQENLQVKFPDNKEQTSKTDNFVFARDQEERSELRASTKETLQDVFRQLSYTLPTHQHRYRLVRYNGVWRGADILQWIMDNTTNKTRVQATSVCQNLLNSGYMECVTELPHFADYALYRPVAVVTQKDDAEVEPEEPTRLVESVSSYCLDLNLGESSARLTRNHKTEAEKPSTPSEEQVPVVPSVEEAAETKTECKALSAWGSEHLRLLMRQWLARASLSASWLEVLYPLCVQAADIIVPDPLSNDIDVRNYVQVKKVPGGSPKDSCLIRGVVLTKNVAHRGMPVQISNPSILLLDGSIAYQRVEGKLTSLEPVLLQEHEYLVRCAARITALRAHVVLVGGGAGGAVCAGLLRARAALALGVRPRALRRAARATRADLLASIDARIGMPRLGTADNFYVKNFGSKTLMVLEGCSEPQLACCILLRGGTTHELVRLKKIVKFMLLACYNWILEKAFLTDIEAVLPTPGTFDDDTNDEKNSENSDVFKEIDRNDVASVFENLSADNNDIFDKKDSDTGIKTDKIDVNCDETSTNIENVKNSENSNLKCLNTDTEESTNKTTKTETKDSKIESDNSIEYREKDDSLEDPLKRPKSYTRRTENLSCGVPIKDFSDPLRATMSDDDVFLPKEEAKLQADAQNDRWCADDVVLSMSPSVLIPAPYLETEAGRRCPLRSNFHAPLLRSPPAATTPLPLTPRLLRKQTPMSPVLPLRAQELHPFVKMSLRSTADDPAQRAALASYRAAGCRLHPHKHSPSCPKYKPSVIRKQAPAAPPERAPAEEAQDPFAPENHQKLNVLLYSFSQKSPNRPDFCVNPWIVTMEMYGRHDISLGAFLHKYCFNSDCKCNPTSCPVPMNQHVRRFVHGDVCITITCNTIGHSNVDKPKEEPNKQVMFWWRCEQCPWTSRGAALSPAALRLSLAQYIRARAAAARPLPPRAACNHPLHTALHAFQSGLTTACFRFSKISMYDIVLPPAVIATQHEPALMRDSLIAQLNDIMLKGHETFSNIANGEADKEHAAFKHHMDQIHVALTSPSLHDSTTDAVVRSLWSISDGIISGEKMLRDAQDKWSSPPAKAKPPPETTVEEKSDLDESSGEASNSESGTTYVFSSDNNTKDEKDHSGIEEDEEKGDKKTIRQILSQLLSSNQSANQAGMIVCGGLVPVVVRATETGSVIAAALASPTYRRAPTMQRHSTQSEQEETDASKEKTDGEKAKAKSNEHVEVLLKDGLVCRVYYAAQFQALRHAVIAPLEKDYECSCDDDKKLCSIEEGFIRSLAHCVPWATRGGKSGSTFCKTKDDRYVLKEMTKPEWQQFLEFAPHYFNYVASCRQTNLPSLLARILGVFSVGGAGDGVLVLENVWYSCPSHTRFDLKGSSRHRLAPRDPALLQPVLMDENLLMLRWERPLYVRGHSARVLWASMERDTSFLAAHGVMDYSLLLALGEHDLVLGVIDYIRTFTWDKKLEHLVKKNLGSGQPTVVSPEQYKLRFIAANKKYFLHCPEPWDQFYDLKN